MKIHYLKFSIWLCKIQDYNFRILSSRRAALGRPPDGDWRRTKVAQSVYISLQRHCADSRRLETRGTQAEAETRGHLSAGFNHYKPRNVPGLLFSLEVEFSRVRAEAEMEAVTRVSWDL